MKSSEALRQIRLRFDIQWKHSQFVCLSLRDIGAEQTAVYRTLNSLFSGTSVMQWLEKNHRAFHARMMKKHGSNFWNIYRLAWIDQMIEDYEAKGD